MRAEERTEVEYEGTSSERIEQEVGDICYCLNGDTAEDDEWEDGEVETGERVDGA